jgi:hypothetical protein
MLVAGAGFELDDRGDYNLKGVDGTWQLFAPELDSPRVYLPIGARDLRSQLGALRDSRP